MATTTATITIASTDLISDELSLTTTATLTAAGNSTGLVGTGGLGRKKTGGTSQYILIHTGTTDEHTAGCLIVGDAQENNQLLPDGFVGKSVNAYKRIYPSIAKAVAEGEEVTIEYIDYD